MNLNHCATNFTKGRTRALKRVSAVQSRISKARAQGISRKGVKNVLSKVFKTGKKVGATALKFIGSDIGKALANRAIDKLFERLNRPSSKKGSSSSERYGYTKLTPKKSSSDYEHYYSSPYYGGSKKSSKNKGTENYMSEFDDDYYNYDGPPPPSRSSSKSSAKGDYSNYYEGKKGPGKGDYENYYESLKKK
jgi:hypothetical protein